MNEARKNGEKGALLLFEDGSVWSSYGAGKWSCIYQPEKIKKNVTGRLWCCTFIRYLIRKLK